MNQDERLAPLERKLRIALFSALALSLVVVLGAAVGATKGGGEGPFVPLVCGPLTVRAPNGDVATKLDDNGDVTVSGKLTVKGIDISSAEIRVPVGTIVAYAGLHAPDSWLIADGSILNPAEKPEYAELATLLGKVYDPEGKNVRLPDLRGLCNSWVRARTWADSTKPGHGGRP